MNEFTKRLDKLDARIDGEVARNEARLNKLWDVAMQRITASENSIKEVNEKSSANFQRIIILALMGLGSIVIALIEVIVHHT